MQAGLSHGEGEGGWSPFLDLGGGKEKQNLLCWTGQLPRKVYF